ncbi:MAG: hypothetical protein JXR31_11220 [Prolixibacteraceae bacterium]|nr:hypothetical protein [Prolixibacteraceae bacterium]MBN2774813.1 hypothetical protein [Prolixibacteraceae bacterium]
MKKIIFAFVFILSCLNSISQISDVSIPFGQNFENADFRFWIPDSDSKIKALLVIVPGHNYDGRDAIYDKIWQGFAQENNLGLVACYFKDHENASIAYREASKGSGQALLDAIQRIAAETGKKEWVDLPLILWGHSAGGQFNYEFACWKPEKVLTFIVNKGGFYHTAIAPEATRKIPAIFFMGENDLYYRKDMIKGIYSVNRRLGAIWTLVEEKNTAHETGISIPFGLEYFKIIIPERLTAGNKLKDLSDANNYIGDWETKTIKSGKEDTNPDVLSVWLPNASFAKAWETLYK